MDLPIEGQMSGAERDAIQQLVQNVKPCVVAECGTWYGGGSTLAIIRGLLNNRKGILYSWETDEEKYLAASDSIRRHLPGSDLFVRFFNRDFALDLDWMASTSQILLLDGASDSGATMSYMQAADRLGSPGQYVILHDWDEHKCESVKSTVENQTFRSEWDVLLRLESITGMVVLRKGLQKMGVED